jgi:deoxyribose-phosphate aldolase
MADAMRDVARRALASLDLTNLDADCDREAVLKLCRRASTPFGHVAAVCVWGRFAADARKALAGGAVHVACVVNFPEGQDALDVIAAETRRFIDAGADEIDVVIDWRSLLAGEEAKAAAPVAGARKAAGADATLKAILETGELKDERLIRRASEIAIAVGADFIKTSTGKVKVNATPEAMRTMLSVIAGQEREVGLKPSGGIRTVAEAALYLGIADEIMGAKWATPETFRFGASSLLDAILATLEGRAADKGSGY